MHQYAERNPDVDMNRQSLINKKMIDKQYGSTQRPPMNTPKNEEDYQEDDTIYKGGKHPILGAQKMNRQSIYAHSQRAQHITQKYKNREDQSPVAMRM